MVKEALTTKVKSKLLGQNADYISDVIKRYCQLKKIIPSQISIYQNIDDIIKDEWSLLLAWFV